MSQLIYVGIRLAHDSGLCDSKSLASVSAEPSHETREGWEDFFRGIVAALNYMENGFSAEQEQLAMGLCSDHTAQSILTSYLGDKDWLADIAAFAEVYYEHLDDLPLPVSIPRPTVNILVSDWRQEDLEEAHRGGILAGEEAHERGSSGS